MRSSPKVGRSALRAHERILDAIAAHDADASAVAMDSHLADVEGFHQQAQRRS
jgi:DNA-binding FadR family transcriptional regulator